MSKRNKKNSIGLSQKQKLDRWWMVERNREELLSLMNEATVECPVGLVIDVTGQYGRMLAVLLKTQQGEAQDEAERSVDELITTFSKKGQRPTVLAIVSWGQAEKFLPLTSPTAKENLKQVKIQLTSELRLVVGIGTNGNTYGVVAV